MKKRPDLKQRLNELRHEPEPPMEVTLHLEPEYYRILETLAAETGVTLKAFLENALYQHVERELGDGE